MKKKIAILFTGLQNDTENLMNNYTIPLLEKLLEYYEVKIYFQHWIPDGIYPYPVFNEIDLIPKNKFYEQNCKKIEYKNIPLKLNGIYERIHNHINISPITILENLNKKELEFYLSGHSKYMMFANRLAQPYSLYESYKYIINEFEDFDFFIKFRYDIIMQNNFIEEIVNILKNVSIPFIGVTKNMHPYNNKAIDDMILIYNRIASDNFCKLVYDHFIDILTNKPFPLHEEIYHDIAIKSKCNIITYNSPASIYRNANGPPTDPPYRKEMENYFNICEQLMKRKGL